MTHYNSLNDYCRKEFGKKLYKLSLEGATTCPNRDGTVGTGGCIFCSDEGSGEFSEKRCNDINLQIENAKKRVEHKNRNGGYIAYFQSFTNTYAPIDFLRKIFTDAISHPDIDVLSIATRPDCLGDEVIELLKELNSIKPVWVELGFQTSNEKSAEFIRRGYRNEVFSKAVQKLSNIGIKVVAHVIIGLPNETYEDMKNTVKFVCDSGIWGIKLHLLHVLKGTDLEKIYSENRFRCFEMNEYIDIICSLVETIPDNIIIHRLTGDGDKKKLVAPLWSGNKRLVLNELSKTMDIKCIQQGKQLLSEKYS